MAISFNLKFRKLNSAGRSLLEKEGEILLHERGFQLKGKGAHDQGELLHFSDIKEIHVLPGESFEFVTFLQYKFILSNFGNLFEQFIRDLYRVRNEFLIDALFLRQGKFLFEDEGTYEILDEDNNSLQKDSAKFRISEESIVLIPEQNEAFSVPFSFLKMHEFDEDEYRLKTVLEDGRTVYFSQFSNGFEEFQEIFEQALTVMYTDMLKQFQNFFMSHNAAVLVKLVNAMKRGKAVRLKDLEKIDKELTQKIQEVVFKDDAFLKTIEPLKKDVDSEHLFIGLNIIDGNKDVYRFSTICAVPEKNIIGCTIGSYEGDLRKVQDTYFFKIAEDGKPSEEDITRKVLELNEALTLLHFVPDPFYKDKKELRKSLYNLAIRKLPFLRNLRRNFLGRCPSILPEIFKRNFEKFREMAGTGVTVDH